MSGYIDTGEETWRTIEVNTNKPGALGALIGKRVYQYSTRATTTPSSTNDYTYTYDAVGNVQVIYRASGTVGQEAYFFAQDAFGNALATGNFSGTNWSTAHTAGITEHQTGSGLIRSRDYTSSTLVFMIQWWGGSWGGIQYNRLVVQFILYH